MRVLREDAGMGREWGWLEAVSQSLPLCVALSDSQPHAQSLSQRHLFLSALAIAAAAGGLDGADGEDRGDAQDRPDCGSAARQGGQSAVKQRLKGSQIDFTTESSE